MRILIFLITFNLLAIEPINKGDIAKQDGWLFSKEEEKVARFAIVRSRKLEEITVAQENLINSQDKQIVTLKEVVRQYKVRNTLHKIGYFMLGVLTVGGSVYLTNKLTRR